jgi:hypothetical protein
VTRSRTYQGAAAVILLALASPSLAGEVERGALVGWVEDTRGAPVAGAVISLFARGATRGGFVTLSDSAGRFELSSLPAGLYTLRAQGRDHEAAQARQVTVVPNKDSIFSLSLAPLGPLSEAEERSRARELQWLLRHRRRSILESQGPIDLASLGPPVLPDVAKAGSAMANLGGAVEFMANPAALGLGPDLPAEDIPAGLSVVRLGGRFHETARWSLGGLVTESNSTSWRMAAEFAAQPAPNHDVLAAAGYGNRMLRPVLHSPSQADDHGVGALSLEDRFVAGPVTASYGVRYTYVGYVRDPNHVDPRLTLELHEQDGTVIRGMVNRRTLVPGGDPLNLSTLAAGPALAFAVMEPGLRPERIGHYELAVDRGVGGSTLTAFTFFEEARDPMINDFVGPRSSLSLRITNALSSASRGVGFSVSRRLGRAVRGSVSYTYGRAWRDGGPLLPGIVAGPHPAPQPDPSGMSACACSMVDEANYHDVVTRFETVIDRSDTRVLVFYRLNAFSPDDDRPLHVSSRFDVQLRQGLPLIGQLTGADWELMVAFRNLYYEATEAASLDEIAVSRPPRRVLGGISVRF